MSTRKPPRKAPDPHPPQHIRHRSRLGTFKRPLKPDDAPPGKQAATPPAA